MTSRYAESTGVFSPIYFLCSFFLGWWSTNQILLLDSSLHYISNLLREELPEGDWTVQDGIALPEYTVVYRKTE